MDDSRRLLLAGCEPGQEVAGVGYFWDGHVAVTPQLDPNGDFVSVDASPQAASALGAVPMTDGRPPLFRFAGTWTGSSLSVSDVSPTAPPVDAWTAPIPRFDSSESRPLHGLRRWSGSEQMAAWARVGERQKAHIVSLKSLVTDEGLTVFVAAILDGAGETEATVKSVYGDSVVVVRSSWSRGEFDAIELDISDKIAAWELVLVGVRVTPRGLLEHYVQAAWISPTIRHWHGQQPEGMVHLVPWLSPG